MSFVLEHFSWIWQFALPFVVVLGVVVLFHEFGHYVVAKWLGVTVEVFSVGFGPRIFGWTRGGTDYRVSWVPLAPRLVAKTLVCPPSVSCWIRVRSATLRSRCT